MRLLEVFVTWQRLSKSTMASRPYENTTRNQRKSD